MSIDWKRLQNGSDIRGIALEGIEGQHVNLTPEVVQTIASAFGVWLSRRLNKDLSAVKVAVGRDSRLSGPAMMDCVKTGLTGIGASVTDCGLASTPAMFMAMVTEGYDFDGSIMLTASHLPFNRNGLKFFVKEGGLEKADISAILDIAAEGGFVKADKPGAVDTLDFISVYAAGLTEKIRKATGSEKPLSGFKIVVDAGNGAGGFYVEKVLKPLGADTTGSQFLDPDGSFPNHIPNPEDKTAMAAICKAVLDNNADFGIIFDTDVDRAGAVDRFGHEINRNRIIAVISAIMIGEYPGSAIVTDSITSSGLKKFIEQDLGGVHHRFKRGYRNVINEAIRLNAEGTECHVAIETSGHGALKENYFLDDGAYLVSKILVKMAGLKKEGKTIDQLIETLEEPLEAAEFRMNILTDDFRAYGTQIIEDLTVYAAEQDGWMVEPKNYEGIRVSFGPDNGDGWFLLRLSLHDPLIPLNIESNVEGGVKAIAAQLYPFVKKYDKLDSQSLAAAVEA
ncbi:MAG: phosphomannomutase/phosphoglucomutase [Clostridiales bacterium]|nr:phosphomannomutase/phosphoglucomutase [Clostridiales bacterium]